jgi:hypothetical protein
VVTQKYLCHCEGREAISNACDCVIPLLYETLRERSIRFGQIYI